jgi:hypothetical protein
MPRIFAPGKALTQPLAALHRGTSVSFPLYIFAPVSSMTIVSFLIDVHGQLSEILTSDYHLLEDGLIRQGRKS